ncbi:unnamed protein product [Rotaria sordida]|uniref:Peptidase S1 domain-containing protein n=1 Tax=Rotaria sordida TaxID=392033 RepID=A0A818ZHG6_9BILA|nr:unnamed protein product [Rotaria sordida]CAF3763694.1 unnamed protein product [Rotaria sordida]
MLIAFLFNLFFIQIIFTTITSITYSCWTNSTCGCSLNSAILTKIIGGEEATMNSWGWAVSIRRRNNHICGGSLISSELILTAAHCLVSVKTLSSLSVTAGSNYLSIINQQRSVSEIFIHQNYDSMTYINDIAIIRLSSSFDMSDRSLAIICLPPSLLEYPSNDTTVIAIGWGVLSPTEKISSDTLQQVTLKIVANTISICYVLIHNENGQICAGVQGGGKDTCQGDSGGPLMMFSNKKWYIVGITSYGDGCALPLSPGVYTRVSIHYV